MFKRLQPRGRWRPVAFSAPVRGRGRLAGAGRCGGGCVWPSWLQRRYMELPTDVSLYRHVRHGLVYAVRKTWTGPSSWEVTHHCVAHDWYSAETSRQLTQTRHYTDIDDPSREVTYEQWDAAQRAADKKWWSEVTLVEEQCAAPPLCARPAFLNQQWARDQMGLNLPPRKIRDDLQVHRYRHRILGDVFSITYKWMADAQTRLQRIHSRVG